MTSSKKKKGQQRKAAKSQAMANYGVSSSRELAAKIEVEAKFIEGVAGARDLPTRGLSVEYDKHSSKLVPGQVHKRALPHILNFLKRCEDETFDQVVASVGVGVNFRDDMRTPLRTPSTWIEVLDKAMRYEPGCSLHIAESIGPLVSCMCNDTGRLFFKSNKHWREGVAILIGVIHNMIKSNLVPDANEGNKEIIDVLLQHDGLLTSIVQWGFWNDEYRPDLVEDLGSLCGIVVEFGKSITKHLVCSIAASNNVSKRDEALLETIGSTPIVSKDYDPTCMISYVEGLIRQMKTNGFDTSDLQTFNHLYASIDCVDRGVIIETVDLGLSYATEFTRAFSLAFVLLPMMRQGHVDIPSDTRIALAIRAGLIEMYLCFIDRFGEHKSFTDESFIKGVGGSSLYNTIRRLLKDIHSISLHQKTAMAIRSKRESIEKELARLQQNISITNDIKSMELLDIIRATLDLNGSYCCRCNKFLIKTDVLECNGCHRMSYCLRACQKEDWLNGHSVTCCKSYTAEIVGQFQGRLLPVSVPENERAATKMKELETNLNMIQLKLFLDSSETILAQAEALNIPLYDCDVRFDLRKCPPAVEVSKYTETSLGFDETRSKKNITCIYASSFYFGDSEEGLAMQRFFPHEWLVRRSTS